MKKGKYLSLFLFVAFGFLVSAFCTKCVYAATYYVSKQGANDISHGTGSGSNAWLTVEYALGGGKINRGDTLIIESGAYEPNSYFNINLGSGSGTTTIRAADGAQVSINIGPAVTNRLMYTYDPLYFKDLSFTNTNNNSSDYIWMNVDQSVTFDNVLFDKNNNGSAIRIGPSENAVNITCKRCRISNMSNFIYSSSFTGSSIDTIDIESSIAENIGKLVYLSQHGNVRLINNTIVKVSGMVTSFGFSDDPLIAINNIFELKDIATAGINTVGDTAFYNDPLRFYVKNNIFWKEAITDYTDLDYLMSNTAELVPYDQSNYFIDPQFIDYTNGNYNLADTSLANGRGASTALPSTDKNGNNWTGNDVGAYKNPTASVIPLDLITGKTAFVGDSIMLAQGIADGQKLWQKFSTNTGFSVVDGSLAAIGGIKVDGVRFWVDKVITLTKPKTIFLAIGVNNLLSSTTRYPTSLTDQQLATEVGNIMNRIKNWGAQPIWLGVESLKDNQTQPESVNTLVNGICIQNGWSCGSILQQMKRRSDWQTYYYDDLANNLHPNSNGDDIIARLAEYLYYPKFSITSDKVDPSGSILIYRDGKYRYTSATSTSMSADLKVVPQGDYNVDNYDEYMNISNLTWQTTGNKNKQWTASSTIETPTIFTVGDLLPNTYYNFKLDGTATSTVITGATCINHTCKSNSDGKITLTYTGGYSTHTFDLIRDTTAPTIPSLLTPTDATSTDNNLPTFTWTASTDADSGLAKYQLFIDSTLAIDNIHTTSVTLSEHLSFGPHAWKVRAIDNEGNYVDSSVFTVTINDITNPAGLTLQSPSDGSSINSFNPTFVWTAASDTESGIAKYQLYVDSNLSKDNIAPGTTSTNLDSNLLCGNHSWQMRVIDASGNHSDSPAFGFFIPCLGASLPSGTFNPPTAPQGGFKVVINNEAFSTNSPKVNLSLAAGSDTVNMAISENLNFTGASLEPYTATKVWTLSVGPGPKTIYVKFYTQYGQSSSPVSATITLATSGSTGNPSTTVAQVKSTPAPFKFNRNLKGGDIISDVRALQQFLNRSDFAVASSGPGSKGKETTTYGAATARALMKFQRKYGIKPVNGVFGTITRNKANALISSAK